MVLYNVRIKRRESQWLMRREGEGWPEKKVHLFHKISFVFQPAEGFGGTQGRWRQASKVTTIIHGHRTYYLLPNPFIGATQHDERAVKLTGKKCGDERGVCGAKNASRTKPTADYRAQVM